MPGRRWTGEEKTNIMREILTASTPTAEVCRKYKIWPTLSYSWKASFVQTGTVDLSGTDAPDIGQSSWNKKTSDSRKW